MKSTQRQSLGVTLTVFGWVLSGGGVAVAAIVMISLSIAGGGPVQFMMAVLMMIGFIAAGPVFVNWGDQLRFPEGKLRSCPTCDYDLRGRPNAGCPECGWQRERGAGSATSD